MPLANEPTKQIYSSQFTLTATPQLVAPAANGRVMYAQVLGSGTAIFGSQAGLPIGIEITGSQVFDDYTSAPWYAVALTGTVVINVLIINN